MHLENFRSYTKREIKFSGKVNVILGKNGCGKTNVLEAIFFLATTRSHRHAAVDELVNWAAESFYIRAAGVARGLSVSVEMGFGRDGTRSIKVNGKPVRQSRDVIGVLPVVMFSPEDLLLIKGDPAQRRRFLDMFISQVSPEYLSCLQKYNKVLLERNRALQQVRDRTLGSEALDVWDENLAKPGYEIAAKRSEVIELLEKRASGTFSEVSGGQGLALKYVTAVKSEKQFLEKLREKKRIETEIGLTTIGPHRDDLLVLAGGRNLREYGSQGQQRVAAISLKLGQLAIMKEALEDSPMILLDDVTSELDAEKKNRFLEFLAGDKKEEKQVFITATAPDEFFSGHGGVNVINL